MISSSVVEVFDFLTDRFFDRMAARFPALARPKALKPLRLPGWIHQAESDLSVRLHCAAVDRRIAENKPGAMRDGKDCYLTREALDEECGARRSRGMQRALSKTHDPDNDIDHELLAKLNARKGARS